jgi:hypothetical protein
VDENLVQHRGACHCGRVRFEVDAPIAIDALECNCSICSKSGFLHLIVPRSRFRLLQAPRTSQPIHSTRVSPGIYSVRRAALSLFIFLGPIPTAVVSMFAASTQRR